MPYIANVRFDYFEVACQNNNNPKKKDGLFDLLLFIDRLDKMKLQDRTCEYKGQKIRVETIKYNNKKELWFMGFTQLRDTNIPSLAKENSESKPIKLDEDEYLGENACGVYDPRYNILMLQRNIHSVSPTSVEWYINKISDNNSQQVYLRPICPIDIQRKLLNAQEYRRINIKLANFKNAEIKGEKRALGRVVDSLTGYNANRISLSISIGYEKDAYLDKKIAKDTISDLIENKDIVAGAEVSFRETIDSNVEVLDLFEAKLHDIIRLNLERRETVASEYMENVMTTKYIESKGKIIAALDR